jgi:uncharacterized spore protein YtfJ
VDDLKHGEMYAGMGHKMKKGFGVKRAFGEPIKVNDDVTIIPVAKVKMSGGGGGGEEMKASESPAEGEAPEEQEAKGQGGGFGFMGGVKPVGYIKVKGSCVKFHRIHDWEYIAKAMIPVCVVILALLKHKMMHFKKMGYAPGMGQAAGPCGPGMMHKHGHMHPGHGHMHGHGAGMHPMAMHHPHHHMHHGGMHPHGPCDKKMMMKGKGGAPVDWRANKKEWKKHAKAAQPC